MPVKLRWSVVSDFFIPQQFLDPLDATIWVCRSDLFNCLIVVLSGKLFKTLDIFFAVSASNFKNTTPSFVKSDDTTLITNWVSSVVNQSAGSLCQNGAVRTWSILTFTIDSYVALARVVLGLDIVANYQLQRNYNSLKLTNTFTLTSEVTNCGEVR